MSSSISNNDNDIHCTRLETSVMNGTGYHVRERRDQRVNTVPQWIISPHSSSPSVSPDLGNLFIQTLSDIAADNANRAICLVGQREEDYSINIYIVTY